MLARLLSAILTRPFVAPTCRAVALAKAEACPVGVKVKCGWGETGIVIVGLPDAAVKESRDRLVKPNPLCRFR